MLQGKKPPTATPQAGQPKTAWRVIEGETRRILQVIEGILESTGDDTFEVEFRIHGSALTKPDSPKPGKQVRPKRTRARRLTRRTPPSR